MARLVALLLIFGTLTLKANDVVCPLTQVYIATEQGFEAVRPKVEQRPAILEIIKEIFKGDPSCKCVVKLGLHPSGRVDYQCLAKRPS